MALKSGTLKAGLKAGMSQEKQKADRFALADQATSKYPQGMLKVPPAGTFGAESSAVQAERRIVKIPIEQLTDNPENARKIYDPKVVQERAASMAKDGQKTPVMVAANPARPGFYIMIDGHYRKRGAQALGWHELECMVEEVENELDFYRLSFLMNEERESQTALDNALAWSELLASKKIRTNNEIVALLGISEGQVSKTMALLNLPPAVLDLMREHPQSIGLHAGYELVLYAKVVGPEDALVLASRVISEKLSSRDIEELRKQQAGKKPRKAKDLSRQYKIKNALGIGASGVIKDWDSGRVMLDLKIPDPKKREEVVEELKRRYGRPAD
ncbi:MAG: ParB/RepB/Spo0J family partition protein [Anaerolineae bacterium]|nr:ParB/RepB/Spo0J family partition protein [Anaerolineae bacterium]